MLLRAVHRFHTLLAVARVGAPHRLNPRHPFPGHRGTHLFFYPLPPVLSFCYTSVTEPVWLIPGPEGSLSPPLRC